MHKIQTAEDKHSSSHINRRKLRKHKTMPVPFLCMVVMLSIVLAAKKVLRVSRYRPPTVAEENAQDPNGRDKHSSSHINRQTTHTRKNEYSCPSMITTMPSVLLALGWSRVGCEILEPATGGEKGRHGTGREYRDPRS